MYLSIKPSNPLIVKEDLGHIFFKDKTFRPYEKDASGYQLEFYEGNSKQNIPFGHINYFYRFEGSQVLLDFMDLFLYKQPEYVDMEAVFTDFVSNLMQFNDSYEVTDYFQDKTYTINANDKDKAASQLTLSFKSAYEVHQNIVDQLSGVEKGEKIFTILKDLSPSFQNLMISEHIYNTYTQNPDKGFYQEIVEHCYKNIEKSKIKDKDLLLYKVMIGGKSLYSYLFPFLPRNFYLNRYSTQIGKLEDRSREISQIMITEFVAACSANLLEGAEPIVRTFAESAEEENALFAPEILHMQIRYTTGNNRDAINKYLELEKENKELRNLYNKIVGPRSSLLIYRKNLLLNTEGLDIFTQIKVRGLSALALFSLKSSPQLAFIISTIVLVAFLIFLSIESSNLRSDPSTAYTNFSMSLDLIVGYTGIAYILLFPQLWLTLGVIKWLMNKSRDSKPSERNKWAAITMIASMAWIFSLAIYLFIVSIIFISTVEEANLYAIKEDEIQIGLDSTPYSEIQDLSIRAVDCDDCKSLIINFSTKEKEDFIVIRPEGKICTQIIALYEGVGPTRFKIDGETEQINDAKACLNIHKDGESE